jgi:exosortase/archaeosortase family protein
VLVFGLLLGGFNLVFYLWFSKGEAFEAYLRLNARCSAAILSLFGDPATTNGTAIIASRYSLDIRRGCDALQASAFFVLGVLSSPSRVPLIARLPVVLLGTVFLLVTNLVRIVSLYYTGVYCSPRVFEVMHVDVWQAMFIFLPLFLWVAWARWAERGETATADVSAY